MTFSIPYIIEDEDLAFLVEFARQNDLILTKRKVVRSIEDGSVERWVLDEEE